MFSIAKLAGPTEMGKDDGGVSAIPEYSNVDEVDAVSRRFLMKQAAADSGPEVTVDLRSDTVTRPSREMRAAMAAAAVGDSVYGEDPTTAKLERKVAEICGKEAGLLVPSGMRKAICEFVVPSHATDGLDNNVATNIIL